MTYNHEVLAALRAEGHSWAEIAGRYGGDTKKLRVAHGNWAKRRRDAGEERAGGSVVQKWLRTEEGTVHVKMPSAGWTRDEAIAFWEESCETFTEWQPRVVPPPVVTPTDGVLRTLAVVSLYDSHFGMRADAEELGPLGEDYDLTIASATYDQTVDRLVSLSRVYDPQSYLIPLGHDFSHVNQYMGVGLTTRAGTEQDTDGRLWKIHRAVCQSAVRLIETVRSTGKEVHVVMVPGNHDPDENFKLGMFLSAWFTQDPGVRIDNSPTQHSYVGWGKNAFMLTHGEHYLKRNGQSPLLVFANECPPDIWERGHQGGRYILSGHLHARRAGQYTPTSDVTEEAGIVSYVLPGLTATDAWHQRQNYRHQRAATLQIFQAEGGLLGHHEIRP